MNRATFDRILKEEGITSQVLLDRLWHSRPGDNLEEAKVREAARLTVADCPKLNDYDDLRPYSKDYRTKQVSATDALLTLIARKDIPDGEPCGHPGCLSHVSHPCEGCGRRGGKSA